jgi:hypothetical protein
MRFNVMMTAAVAVLAAQPASADTVTDWWEVSNRYYGAGQAAPGPRTADMERASARTAIAMFEAVNAIDRRYESYLGIQPGDPKASQDAAAATAAYKVLLHHYPANKTALDDSHLMAMDGIPAGPARDMGQAIGEQAAVAAIAANGVVASIAQPPYRPRTSPGAWIGAALPSLDSYWLALKPWAFGSPDELRPPPPPPVNSETYGRDVEEVRRLGAKASKERTPKQTIIARYRQGFDPSPAIRMATDAPGRRQVDNARLLALYQLAFDDAVQGMIAAKIHYDFWRPLTAIRNADQDDNPATTHDPNWTPLLGTPNFQEYPCGHCAAVAAQAEVMKALGGLPSSTPIRVASPGNPNSAIQRVANWDELVRQVSDSRMLGGVHYRFSNEAGEQIGRKAAHQVMQELLRPLKRKN